MHISYIVDMLMQLLDAWSGSLAVQRPSHAIVRPDQCPAFYDRHSPHPNSFLRVYSHPFTWGRYTPTRPFFAWQTNWKLPKSSTNLFSTTQNHAKPQPSPLTSTHLDMLRMNTTSHDLQLHVDLLFTWDPNEDDGAAIWSYRAVDTQDCHEGAGIAYNFKPTLKKLSSDGQTRTGNLILKKLSSGGQARTINLFSSFVPLLLCLLLQVGGSLSSPDLQGQNQGQNQHICFDETQLAYYTCAHAAVENIMIHGNALDSARDILYTTDIDLHIFGPVMFNTATCYSFIADLVKRFGEPRLAAYDTSSLNFYKADWVLEGVQFESLCGTRTTKPMIGGTRAIDVFGPGCPSTERGMGEGKEPDVSSVEWMKGPRMTAEERTFLYPPIFLVASCLLWEHGFGE